MKPRTLPFLIAVFLSLSPNLLFAEPDNLTREEWFAIPDSNKTEFVLMAINQLEFEKVPITKTPKEYVKEINEVYIKKPDLPETSISILLPSIIYKTEPSSREIIDKLVKKHALEIIKNI